jgi:hypothetical protein
MSLQAEAPATLTPVETWARALVPSESNFDQIARDPNASTGRILLWITAAAVIGSTLYALLSAGLNAALDLPPLLPGMPDPGSSLATDLLCGVPIGVILAIVSSVIGAALTHFLATAMGGRGKFTQLWYAFAAIMVPTYLINSILLAIPCVNLLVLFTALYTLLLTIVATKAVHQFGYGQAVMSSLVVPIGAVILVACGTIVILALLGPAIGDVFSEIVNEI